MYILSPIRVFQYLTDAVIITHRRNLHTFTCKRFTVSDRRNQLFEGFDMLILSPTWDFQINF
jgi:hypothetical protein